MTRSPRSLLQAEDSQSSQPFLKGFMFQFWNHLHGPTLDLLQYVHVSLLLLMPRTGPSTPEVSSVLIPLFYMLVPQAFFFQAALRWWPPASRHSVVSPQVQDFAFLFVGTSWGSCWPFSSVFSGPFDGNKTLLFIDLSHFCTVCKLAEGVTLSHHLGLLVLSSISSSIHPWGTPPSSLLRLALFFWWPPLSPAAQPVCIHLTDRLSSLYLSSLSVRMLWETVPKAFLKLK